MSLNLKLTKIISFLKISIHNRNTFVKYKKNQLLVSLLECFLENGFISGFFENEGFVYILLKYNSLGESVIKDLKVLYKRTFEVHLTYKNLKTNSFYKKYLIKKSEKSLLFILSTNKGIITHKDAINYGIGGQLLLVLKGY